MPDAVKTRTRRRKLSGDDLVVHLNQTVSELIRENRKLKRQIDKLTARGTAAASSNVERALRTLQSRVERAVTSTTERSRRRISTNGRRTATRRRRKSAV